MNVLILDFFLCGFSPYQRARRECSLVKEVESKAD